MKKDHDFHCFICDMVYLKRFDAYMPAQTYKAMDDGKLSMTSSVCDNPLCRLEFALNFSGWSESLLEENLMDIFADDGSDEEDFRETDFS